MIKKLETFFKARVPVLFWGSPGVGKTAAIEAFCRRRGLRLLVPHVRAPEDIAVPVRGEDGAVQVVPVNEFREAAADGGCVIFLDEITTLPPSVQAAALRFLDSGRVGSWSISSKVWRVAAANPPEQAAGGYDLELPVANRLAHVKWRLDATEWAGEFPAYWGAAPEPAELGLDCSREDWERARAEVAAFIKARPELLLQVPSDTASRRWPSPRTWDFASRALAVGGTVEEVADAVGEGPALEFAEWRKNHNLPDPEELLKNPSKVPAIETGDVGFAVVAAVSAAVARKATKGRWEAAWKIVSKVADQIGHDLIVPSVRPLARLRREHPDWPLPEGDILLKVADLLEG